MGFHDLMASASPNVSNCSEEARFSFLEGCYVEDLEPQGKFLSVTVCSSCFRFCEDGGFKF